MNKLSLLNSATENVNLGMRYRYNITGLYVIRIRHSIREIRVLRYTIKLSAIRLIFIWRLREKNRKIKCYDISCVDFM